MNPTVPSPPTRGPERFDSAPVHQQRTSPLAALGAGLALLVLVVGVPVALVLWQGAPPYPTGLPSRDDLTQPLTMDALLVALQVVVWLAWLQFTVCVLVEAAALIRGGGLPRPVPLAGPTQAFARALVGTVLVGASLLGTTGAAQAAAPVADGPVAVAVDQQSDRSATAAPGAGDQAGPSARVDDQTPVYGDERDRATNAAAEVASRLTGQKSVVVQPPDGRYHDNLWDIAERHLGDGRRWAEIFELNKGVEQPDGQQLEIGRLIQPGWVLILPDDATGADVQVTKQDQKDRSEDRAAKDDGGPGSDRADLTDPGPSAESGVHQAGLIENLAGGGLLAAALLGAVMAERRRRRGIAISEAEAEAERSLLIGADMDRAQRLDQALRRLTTRCRLDGIPLPPVYAVTVDDEAIELRIAPAAQPAPAPWSVQKDGRRWRLDRDAEADDSATTGAAPYPGLVCLGRDEDGADVLIDLEQVGGPASISGSDAVAREVVSAIAAQLATSPWSDAQRLHVHDLSPYLAGVGGDRLHEVADLPALVAELTAERPDRKAPEVLSGRLGRQPGLEPQYLLLGAPPSEDLLDQLHAMTRSDARGLGVVAAGAMPDARWQIQVDDTGHLTLPLLDISVTAVRLTERTVQQLGGLLAKARTEQPSAVTAATQAPTPPRPGDDAHWASAPVRVGILGSLELRVAGQMDAERLDLAREVATFLAVQSAPVHPTVLAGAVWPRGVTPEVRDATVARVRDWLGTDASGNYLLGESDDGRLFLSDAVALDWHAVCTLLGRTRGAAEREEKELLRRALQLVRGQMLADRPTGRYTWLPRTRLETLVGDVVEAAAHRLVELSGGDPDGAAAAASAGLRVRPSSQLLLRDLLRARYDGPDGPGTAAALDELQHYLIETRADLQPETEALLEELVPGLRQAGA